MNKTILTTLAATALGLAISQPAHAATSSKTFYLDPGMSCQLSDPSTSSPVRPRATGFRNDGSVTGFVICGLPYYYSGAVPTSFSVVLASFDGAPHTFSCTGVTRFSTGGSPLFVAKSVTTASTGAASTLTWTASDLTMGNFNASVTCALPPGAVILSAQIVVNDEIGS